MTQVTWVRLLSIQLAPHIVCDAPCEDRKVSCKNLKETKHGCIKYFILAFNFVSTMKGSPEYELACSPRIHVESSFLK